MLPGVMLYRGLSETPQNLNILVNALGTALALAGGLAFGEYVAIAVRRQLRLVENRFFAPPFAAPFATERRKSGSWNEGQAPSG